MSLLSLPLLQAYVLRIDLGPGASADACGFCFSLDEGSREVTAFTLLGSEDASIWRPLHTVCHRASVVEGFVKAVKEKAHSTLFFSSGFQKFTVAAERIALA